MPKIHLNIGGNLGDVRTLTARACVLLARALGGRMLLSAYIDSEPWGYESTARYTNRGVLVLTPRRFTPLQVLDITQAIERRLSSHPHRHADGSYCDRPLDIDIIDIDGIGLDTPRLQLPHPRAAARPFVSGPMLELERRLGSEGGVNNF